MVLRIYKQILWFDVSMTIAKRVNIRQCPETLICVEFDEKNWHRLLHLVVVLEDAVDRLWDVIHHNIQIDLVLLVSLRVKRVLERDHIRVLKFLHDLQLAILISLVLIHLLNGHNFTSFCPSRLFFTKIIFVVSIKCMHDN